MNDQQRLAQLEREAKALEGAAECETANVIRAVRRLRRARARLAATNREITDVWARLCGIADGPAPPPAPRERGKGCDPLTN